MDTNPSQSTTAVNGQPSAVMPVNETSQPPDKTTILAVLQLLRKYNLKVSYHTDTYCIVLSIQNQTK